MTIKEIEKLTGMTRANIRFYESEGLIEPHRNANGYREYSEFDVHLLNKIKLLRTLQFSLEEIKVLQKGFVSLHKVLDDKVKHLRHAQHKLASSEQICLQIIQDGVNFETLDANYYFEQLEQSNTSEYGILKSDCISEVHCPCRRFFARCFDILFYHILCDMIVIFVGHKNLLLQTNLSTLVHLLIVLIFIFAFEPVQLSLFGTTLGKWILGLRILKTNGQYLSYSDALYRTWYVISSGLGFQIPLYHIYRLWKCYSDCVDGKSLPWEEDSIIELKDEKFRRYITYILVTFSLFILLFLSIEYSALPPHRGELTEKEFYENYNYLESYFEIDSIKPTFTFTKSRDHITAVTFHFETTDPNLEQISFQDQIILTSLAFVSGRDAFSPFSNTMKEVIKYILNHPHENFEFTKKNITFKCTVSYTGFEEVNQDFLIPIGDTDVHYSLLYKISL